MSCISLENFKKRLKALEEKVARYGIELTDSQIAALERKASDDEACGEIETAHPGYLLYFTNFQTPAGTRSYNFPIVSSASR